MKKTTLFCVIALVVALAMPAYAEVQNVKVSGDITVRGLVRDNYDLASRSVINVNGGVSNKDDRNFYNSVTRVKIDADLTDNVSTTVRLLNQRDWGINTAAVTNNISLDLASVTLKELFYNPLTLTVGRQNLRFGKQLIVGDGLLRNTNGVLTAAEYSADNGYDAIKATLDYNPITVDLVTAKIAETSTVAATVSNDQNLYGVNVGYKFNSYNAEAELYYFSKIDGAAGLVVTQGSAATGAGTTATGDRRTYEENDVHTIGTRGSAEFIKGLHTSGEIGYQFGELRDTAINVGDLINPANSDTQTRKRAAWALDLTADYDIPVEMAYCKKPNVDVEYWYRSGESNSNTGNYNAWDSMYTGKFSSAIAPFLTSVYATLDADDTAYNTNSHTFKVSGSFRPIDKLKAELAWIDFRFAQAPVAGAKKDAGYEIDTQLTYNYTDDVTFGLLAGWFVPGDYYQDRAIPAGVNSRSNDVASTLVGTVSVAF